MARLRFRTRLILIAASVLVVTGAALAVWDSDSPFWAWNSKIEIERDRQPRWQVDPNQPFEITVRHLVYRVVPGAMSPFSTTDG